jgi:Domain of unknown function (DUF4397)
MFQLAPSQPSKVIRRHTLARRTVLSALLVTGFAALTGCQSITGSTSASEVRIVDASPDAPGLDIYQSNSILAFNLGFGTSTSYVPLAPGTYTITADTAGTKQTLLSVKGTFANFSQYTLLISDVSANLQGTILTDQSQAAPAGQISVRFLDEATSISAVDLYMIPSGQKLTSVTPVFTNLTLGINTGYLNIPTGTYTLVMVPTGTVPTSTTIATYSGQLITYSGGSATTIIVLDQLLQTTPPIQVISLTDYQVPSAS